MDKLLDEIEILAEEYGAQTVLNAIDKIFNESTTSELKTA
jgi:hypothetical protein